MRRLGAIAFVLALIQVPAFASTMVLCRDGRWVRSGTAACRSRGGYMTPRASRPGPAGGLARARCRDGSIQPAGRRTCSRNGGVVHWM
jgi:hypothetical protein